MRRGRLRISAEPRWNITCASPSQAPDKTKRSLLMTGSCPSGLHLHDSGPSELWWHSRRRRSPDFVSHSSVPRPFAFIRTNSWQFLAIGWSALSGPRLARLAASPSVDESRLRFHTARGDGRQRGRVGGLSLVEALRVISASRIEKLKTAGQGTGRSTAVSTTRERPLSHRKEPEKRHVQD